MSKSPEVSEPGPLDPGQLEVASLSDTGLQRAHNEDACGESRSADGARLLVVADGMGGHAGGETASRTAVDTLCAIVGEASAASEELLREAFERANAAIHEAARRDARLHGMGTTAVALLFGAAGSAWVAHVGDSRAYRLREGNLEQLTADHSFVAELQRRGLIDADQAAVHPRRNQLLRSMGIEAAVEADLQPLELAPGDRFLLCSDGLSGVVQDGEIARCLGTESPADAARSLVALANERGGPDNITVQVARVPGSGESGSSGPGIRRLGLALGAVALLAVAWTLLGRG